VRRECSLHIRSYLDALYLEVKNKYVWVNPVSYQVKSALVANSDKRPLRVPANLKKPPSREYSPEWLS